MLTDALRVFGSSSKKYGRGFTLVELAIVLVVIAVALSFGTPALIDWMRDAQIRTAAESILNGLQTARTEAVRRNATVEFSLIDPGGAGKTGWEAKLVNGDVLQSKPAAEASMNAVVVQTPVDSVAYSFNGFGRAPSNGLNSDGTNVLTQIEVKSGGATEGRKMRIVITSGGEIRMCDPAVSTDSDDPRKCPL